MMDYENEDEEKIETEPDDSDFAEEHGDVVTCVIQKLQCNQKASTPATTSNILLKVFHQKQGVQPHHRQPKLREHRFKCIGGLFEARDGITFSVLYCWLDQKISLYQVNGSLSCSYFSWQIISRFPLLVKLSILINISWGDCGNTMLMQLIEIRITTICSLGRVKELHENNSTYSKAYNRKRT